MKTSPNKLTGFYVISKRKCRPSLEGKEAGVGEWESEIEEYLDSCVCVEKFRCAFTRFLTIWFIIDAAASCLTRAVPNSSERFCHARSWKMSAVSVRQISSCAEPVTPRQQVGESRAAKLMQQPVRRLYANYLRLAGWVLPDKCKDICMCVWVCV